MHPETYQVGFEKNEAIRKSKQHGSIVPTVLKHKGQIFISNGNLGAFALRVYDPVNKTLRASNLSNSSADKRNVFLWNDLNDDGLSSEDEVLPLNRSKIGGYLNPHDMSIFVMPFGSDYQPGGIFKPEKFTAGGTPVYSSKQFSSFSPWVENKTKFYPTDLRQAEDGSWYGCFSVGARNPHTGSETHGAWYYNSCSAIDRLVKWDKNWQQVWSV